MNRQRLGHNDRRRNRQERSQWRNLEASRLLKREELESSRSDAPPIRRDPKRLLDASDGGFDVSPSYIGVCLRCARYAAILGSFSTASAIFSSLGVVAKALFTASAFSVSNTKRK